MTTTEFRKFALAHAGATEQPHFKEVAFQAGKKIFATLNETEASVVLKFSLSDQEAFCSIDQKSVSPVFGYWGGKGWTTVKLATIDTGLLRDMLKFSYESVSKRYK